MHGLSERASDVQLKDKIDQRLGIGIDAQMQQEVASRFLDCDVVISSEMDRIERTEVVGWMEQRSVHEESARVEKMIQVMTSLRVPLVGAFSASSAAISIAATERARPMKARGADGTEELVVAGPATTERERGEDGW